MNLDQGTIELPGVGVVSHPALGATYRSYWRRRKRRDLTMAAVVMSFCLVGLVVPIAGDVTLYVSAVYLGWVLGHAKGYHEGWDRGLAVERETMMEVQTVLSSLSPDDQDKFRQALEGDEDA